MLDTLQQWDPCGFRDNTWDPCGFEDFCIRNVTMHQSKVVDATTLPAKSLLSTIPLPPSSALPSPSTRRLQDQQSLTPDAPNDRNTSSDATERPAGGLHCLSHVRSKKSASHSFTAEELNRLIVIIFEKYARQRKVEEMPLS